MMQVKAYAANSAGESFKPFTYELPKLGDEQVDIKVSYCGLCHSDYSMWQNDWGNSQFPLVPGHEAVGIVEAVGSHVKNLKVGDRVGLGWFSESCLHCEHCMDGAQNLCRNAEETIVGRHGGFADKVRSHWSWAVPLPEGIEMSKAGPLFCGGITVFSPILIADVKPYDRVGVIGIGGLGHMAVQFLNKWGCEVTAFSSNTDKTEEILAMGAHRVVNSRNPGEIQQIKGQLDFILNTTNVSLSWVDYLSALKPKGTLHTVGAVLEPMAIPAFGLIGGEKTVSGSPLGSIAQTRKMLDFCVRHNIYPITQEFGMSQINDAMQHLKDGKARFRIVLKNDF